MTEGIVGKKLRRHADKDAAQNKRFGPARRARSTDLSSNGPEALVVLVMAPTRAVAMAIARTAVGEGLAAAANVLSEASSIFRWQGELREVAEVPLLLKTHASLCAALMARVAELHPYEVPGIVALPVVAAPASWLAWLGEVTQERA